jgi:ribose/xylose/arabinose/galactoside ABC-type transport system permease subunit
MISSYRLHLKQNFQKNYLKTIPYLSILLVVIVLGLSVPNFMGRENLVNILKQSSAIGIMALGITLVFLVGGIDLSIAANMGLSGIIGAMLMRAGLHPIVACLAMILFSSLVGLINGLAVSYLNMIPFVVTLSMMYIISGGAVWLTESASITGLPENFVNTVLMNIAGIPLPVILMIVLGILTTIFTAYSIYGRWIYAVGSNINAARLAKIPVMKVKVWAYILAGTFAGIAAILNTARLESASASIGGSAIVLDVASSAVIGGVSIYGGVGSPLGAIFGTLIITLISNSMNMIGVSYYITLIVKGVVIIGFIGLDYWLRRKQ